MKQGMSLCRLAINLPAARRILATDREAGLQASRPAGTSPAPTATPLQHCLNSCCIHVVCLLCAYKVQVSVHMHGTSVVHDPQWPSMHLPPPYGRSVIAAAGATALRTCSSDAVPYSVVRCTGWRPAATISSCMRAADTSCPCAAPAARVMLSFISTPPMSLQPAAWWWWVGGWGGWGGRGGHMRCGGVGCSSGPAISPHSQPDTATSLDPYCCTSLT